MAIAITSAEAEQLAIAFLMQDLDIDPDDQEWFSVLNARAAGESWYVVEVGVEGLPDKWVLQVYDTGECDPSYTFSTPVKPSESDTGLAEMPEAIATLLSTQRMHGGLL